MELDPDLVINTVSMVLTASVALTLSVVISRALRGGFNLPLLPKLLESRTLSRVTGYVFFLVAALFITFFSGWIKSQVENTTIQDPELIAITLAITIILYLIYEINY
ncbi:MAG: hypothetical protein V1703_04455 [Candidatus Altiarchaeota archaeon]